MANQSRRARLNLVTSVRRMLMEEGQSDDEAIEDIASACGCKRSTVADWLPRAGKFRKCPGRREYECLLGLNESLVGPKRTRKPTLKRVGIEKVSDTNQWRVMYGQLRKRNGRPVKEDALFKCVGEKLPFDGLGEVERHLSRRRIGKDGVYIAHDSMGVPRYIGRGRIFNRLRALRGRHRSEIVYFSFYVVQGKKHEREIESLLIRTAGPQLQFNERKKRVDIEPGSVFDFEAGTSFYERRPQYRRSS